MKKVYLIIVFLFSAIFAFGQGTVEEAKKFYSQGAYDKAVRIFQTLADKGEVEAKFYLAFCYGNGQGVPQDYSKAVYWYEKAADQGFALAQNNLGILYENGLGVAQDYSKAVYWYEKAANQNFAQAQYNLGNCYYGHQGVSQDYSKAVYWYEKAADQNFAQAQYNLGVIYENGQGVPQDYSKAFYWYKKAADQNFAQAQYNLGVFYTNGTGVSQDYSKAVYWYKKAADQDYAQAQYNLGVFYANGQGVPQDYSKAFYWYKKAADQNMVFAQNNLGVIYENGQGVPQDYSKAVYWYEKAAAQNYDLAKKNLAKLKLTSPQSTNNQVVQNNNPSYTLPTNNNSSQPQDVEKNATCVLDKDIPVTSKTTDNTFAFIVGNENYLDAIKVPFANNDANIFAEYCKRTLGLPKDNVKVYKDATFGVLVNAVSTIKKIAKAYEGKLNLIFYYSGHGIPDDTSHEAFMLPIDADGRNMGICYSLDKLYKELKDTHAQKVLVLLDACFSGAVRGNGMIVEAKGVAIKPKKNVVDGNIVVLSAATDKQTAYPFEQEGHGLFTYYLLKKLHDTCGNVTLGELQSYIKSEVGKKAIVIKGKEQTPTVVTSGTMLNTWKSLPLR